MYWSYTYVLKSERKSKVRIAICDDERIFRSELVEMLIDYRNQHRLGMDIREFENGKSLLRDDSVFDLVFLDYQMDDIDGLETAKIMRKNNDNCSIVFVTSYPTFIREAFEVDAMRFLDKPVSKLKLFESLDSFIKMQKSKFTISVNVDNEIIRIETDGILYIEADGKYSTIRTKEKFYHSSKTLNEIYNMLPVYCFYRSHRSYVVNLYHIKRYDKTRIYFENGEQALISRSKLSSFKKVLHSFVNDYLFKL